MIVKIEKSPLKHKRYRVIMDNGKHYDFGLDTGSTYIDHKDIIKRDNYRKRHLANKTEKILITNLVPSPSLMSYYILWGDYTNIRHNIEALNKLWK